jgi:hypothetical protein
MITRCCNARENRQGVSKYRALNLSIPLSQRKRPVSRALAAARADERARRATLRDAVRFNRTPGRLGETLDTLEDRGWSGFSSSDGENSAWRHVRILRDRLRNRASQLGAASLATLLESRAPKNSPSELQPSEFVEFAQTLVHATGEEIQALFSILDESGNGDAERQDLLRFFTCRREAEDAIDRGQKVAARRRRKEASTRLPKYLSAAERTLVESPWRRERGADRQRRFQQDEKLIRDATMSRIEGRGLVDTGKRRKALENWLTKNTVEPM